MLTAASWIMGGAKLVVPSGRIFYRLERRSNGSGPMMVMLHGFPTWSYDYVGVIDELAPDHDILAHDFLGYGASDKPRDHVYTVAESADNVEALLGELAVKRARLVIHDYGGIVGQELLDRRRRGKLSFDVESVHLMNCGVIYQMYRPRRMQRLLASRLLGRLIASRITKPKLRTALDAVRGADHRLSSEEFEQLWYGISLQQGHTLAYRHIHYNRERDVHAARWLSALTEYEGPLQLIWGLADPVSGARVLEALRPLVPRARVDALPGVGHFPMSEAPRSAAAALRAATAGEQMVR